MAGHIERLQVLRGVGRQEALEKCRNLRQPRCAQRIDTSALYLPLCPFSILAQVSRSVTVRLNTSAPGRASRSTQK
jgi:hypothetical protein